MKIYFDTCSLQRPLDDRSQGRVLLEAEAILAILALVEQGHVSLVNSDVILFEHTNNPNKQRQRFVHAMLAYAHDHISLTDAIEQRAQAFETYGVKAVDALHLASAESYPVDYLCTCDDRFYRRAITIPTLAIPIRTPLALAQELLP